MERLFSMDAFKTNPSFATHRTPFQGLAKRQLLFGRNVNGGFIYVILPPELERVIRILVTGETDTGKSLLIRVLIEGFFDEVVWFRDRIRHPIFIFDYKGNYMGITRPNQYERDKEFLKNFFGFDDDNIFGIPSKFVNIYAPPHAIPVSTATEEGKQKFLELKKTFKVTNVWRIPWRFISDPRWLAGLFKIKDIQTSWMGYLHPILEKAISRENVTMREIIKEGGILEQEIESIGDTRTRTSLYTFLDKWRRYSYMFSETDPLVRHLSDRFSVNVLTFLPTAGQNYSNNLCLLTALESLLSNLQHTTIRTQPIFIFHDLRNALDPKSPLSDQITNALMRLVYGQARTKYHGYIVIFEIQKEKALPRMLWPEELSYHYIFRMKWKTSLNMDIPTGGICDYEDRYHDFKAKNVVVRPPKSHYVI